MAEITASVVADLRKRTGAGMMDCKKALTEADGDVEKAIEILRVKGIAKAATKSDRKTSDGLICSYVNDDHSAGVLVEVNCETDFVARTDDFKAICDGMVSHVFAAKSGNVVDLSGDSLLAEKFHGDPDKTVEEYLKEGVAKLGENMRIPRFARFDTEGANGAVVAYIHLGGKAGVLVLGTTSDAEFAKSAEFATIIEDVAINVCAYNPEFIAPDDVPADVLDKEKAIYREQALADGKPEAIVDKIVMGRVNKYFNECCLLKQPFYKDESGKETVEGYLKKAASGLDLTIRRFARFKLGG
jgi:elongation factor Ts